jgi:hypothetical protein
VVSLYQRFSDSRECGSQWKGADNPDSTLSFSFRVDLGHSGWLEDAVISRLTNGYDILCRVEMQGG